MIIRVYGYFFVSQFSVIVDTHYGRCYILLNADLVTLMLSFFLSFFLFLPVKIKMNI